jgi:hypothetical protein
VTTGFITSEWGTDTIYTLSGSFAGVAEFSATLAELLPSSLAGFSSGFS